MKQLLLLLPALSLLAACEENRHVGDLPGPGGGTPGAGVAFQNLVARVSRSYTCPAGFVGDLDNTRSCSCDTSSFDCDQGPPPIPCTCDPDCIPARPSIDCADYSLTFTVDNKDAQRIDRMTEVKVTAGQLVQSAGGLDCDGRSWALNAGVQSGVVEVKLLYDTGASDRYAVPRLSYPCRDGVQMGDSNNLSRDLGDPLPPAVTSGALLLELRGLYADGAPWTLAASAEL